MVPTPFVYCPYCRESLAETWRHGRLRPSCAACGFVQFSDPKVAVVALVSHEDSVLLIRRKFEPGGGLWALPGGYVDAGEMPEPAIVREVLEETGLDVQAGPLLGIFPLTTARGARGIVLAYAAVVECAERRAPEAGDDVSDARWFGVAELPAELAFDSTIALLAEWAKESKPRGARTASHSAKIE